MKKPLILITGLLILLSALQPALSAQSIAQKKANLKGSDSDLDKEADQFLIKVNEETQTLQAQIQNLYADVYRLYSADAPPEEYQNLLAEINKKKTYLTSLENKWREMAVKTNKVESYGLWHAPDTNLAQLIIDYGSQDYVYLIPPEVGSIKLSVDSNLPIPRSSWSEMLELILTENGVGIKQLNPFLRELFLVEQGNMNLKMITNKRNDLEVLPNTARVSFMLSPEPSEVRRTYTFLEKFINPNSTIIQVLGREILVTGQAGDILDLLKLYDFVATNRGEKEYRLIPVYKAQAAEMAKILEAIFDQAGEEVYVETGKGMQAAKKGPDINGLKIVVMDDMAQALFVVGSKDEVRKAEEVIRNVENQIGGARDKIVFWYTAKHSNAEELADVLYKVYTLMISSGAAYDGQSPLNPQTEVVVNTGQNSQSQQQPQLQKVPPTLATNDAGFYQEGGYIVNPSPAEPKVFTKTNANEGRDNFIVDIKTGAIVMVIESDVLPKIKDLLHKLDVPKKMVQIETLLFEKIVNKENNYGLNLLKIGEHIASNKNLTGMVFNTIMGSDDHVMPGNAGVFDFFLSRKESNSGIPAFDLAYRFLLAQDDIQINSNPSIMTVNQVPATIAINEEISINTGVFEVDNGNSDALKNAYTRAQYGITISIKPTIHMSQDDENQDTDYVSLETDITFDTIQGGNRQRPNVIRRHIENEVQVPDGDTIVLGGLRRKTTQDKREAIPFIGELPGFGKLFSTNTLSDKSSEMFIFITPHIVKDPKEQLHCLRQELLNLRPGDLPYFLKCVDEAQQYEKTRLMEGSMTMLFGRPRERYYMKDCCEVGEYDGR